MSSFSPTFLTRHKALLLLAPAALILACEETIVIDELEPRIVAVGPVDYVDGEVHLYYALNDPAGNDQDLSVAVCLADESACAQVARMSPASDGTTALPTRPAGSDITHLFAWFLGCGKVIDGQDSSVDLQTAYVVRLTLDHGAHEVFSAPFTPGEDFELTELPPCP